MSDEAMADDGMEPQEGPDEAEDLAARLARLEQRLVQAELKTHALRAGMVDLDGLKLLDTGALALDERGELAGGAEMMAELKRAKPWLFGRASSSSAASAPPARAPRARLATEMSETEWLAARTELLRRSGE